MATGRHLSSTAAIILSTTAGSSARGTYLGSPLLTPILKCVRWRSLSPRLERTQVPHAWTTEMSRLTVPGDRIRFGTGAIAACPPEVAEAVACREVLRTRVFKDRGA